MNKNHVKPGAILTLLAALAACLLLTAGCSDQSAGNIYAPDIASVPDFDGTHAWVTIHDNEPYFTESDYTTEAFETYSELDALGRCGVAYANICPELMPTEKRGEIGQVKPSGWHTIRYDGLVDGSYLYNRCHLIGYQLAGENANKKNLITGTRYLNIQGMLDFENEVASYVQKTGNHVLYRVTPVFDGSDLVARGVEMEGWSVEDSGQGVCFNVFAYNNQPGVEIDYATGDSWRQGEDPATGKTQTYVVNVGSGKFHLPDCSSAKKLAADNRLEVTETRDGMLKLGYSPCGVCKP